MDDPEAVLLGEGHHLAEEIQVRHLGGGIVRIAEEKQLGLGPGLAGGGGQILEKVASRADGHAAHVRARDDRRVFMDGIGGVRGQHHIAGLQHGQGEVGQAFLGAHGHDGFAFRVQFHAIEAGVTVTDGLAQIGDALGQGIAVVDRFLRGLHQLVHHMARRGNVGIAHAEIHDVDILPTQLHLEVAHDGKDIRRQALDTRKLFHCTSRLF